MYSVYVDSECIVLVTLWLSGMRAILGPGTHDLRRQDQAHVSAATCCSSTRSRQPADPTHQHVGPESYEARTHNMTDADSLYLTAVAGYTAHKRCASSHVLCLLASLRAFLYKRAKTQKTSDNR